MFEEKKYKRKVESFAKDLLFFDIEKEGRRHTIYYLKYDYKTIQNINELIGTPDPALKQTILTRLEADHIVSMKNITKIDGFDKLTYEQL